ncbi:unnamed protein product [Closterium sp. NIES-64]|nr:unnamed protein product [Closterium sp. NIES-64]
MHVLGGRSLGWNKYLQPQWSRQGVQQRQGKGKRERWQGVLAGVGGGEAWAEVAEVDLRLAQWLLGKAPSVPPVPAAVRSPVPVSLCQRKPCLSTHSVVQGQAGAASVAGVVKRICLSILQQAQQAPRPSPSSARLICTGTISSSAARPPCAAAAGRRLGGSMGGRMGGRVKGVEKGGKEHERQFDQYEHSRRHTGEGGEGGSRLAFGMVGGIVWRRNALGGVWDEQGCDVEWERVEEDVQTA